MPRKTIRSGKLYRSVTITRDHIDEEARTVRLAFSSEEPVDRWFGQEILDHSPSSIRLQRLRDGAPLLVNHNTNEHVGVVEDVSIGSDRRGRALVRIGESARAEEIWRDVVGGIRRHVSVGYRIHKAVLEQTGEDGPDVYRVTDWEPLEISLVPVPADPTVGVGRSAEADQYEIEVEIPEQRDPPSTMETRSMPDKDTPNSPPPATQPQAAPAIDIDAEREAARLAEQERVRSILKLGELHDCADLARQFVDNGRPVEQFQQAVLERLGSRRHPVPDADVGMTTQEARRFSFVRAINALANPTDRRAQEAAAFEFEASAAAAEKLGRESRGITVPPDVLKRDLTVGTATAGGNLVATDLLAQDFITLLRNRMVIAARATQLTDLVGNVAIPRQTSGATAYWVAESAPPTESQQAFDQVTLSPKTVGAFTDISRKLLLQASTDVEAFVRGDLATVLALEIDRASINGSGASNQPTGILNTTGIGNVAGGTNGAAPTWANIIELESDVATANADVGSLAYATNAAVRGKLKQTAKVASTDSVMIWGDGDTPLNGYPVLVTNQVPSNLTKGTGTGLSAIIFGNFADLIVGMWGGLDLTVDPYSQSTSGTVRVVALQDVDIAVRHAESFSAMQDAITV